MLKACCHLGSWNRLMGEVCFRGHGHVQARLLQGAMSLSLVLQQSGSMLMSMFLLPPGIMLIPVVWEASWGCVWVHEPLCH